jgi:hypothetical protein
LTAASTASDCAMVSAHKVKRDVVALCAVTKGQPGL